MVLGIDDGTHRSEQKNICSSGLSAAAAPAVAAAAVVIDAAQSNNRTERTDLSYVFI